MRPQLLALTLLATSGACFTGCKGTSATKPLHSVASTAPKVVLTEYQGAPLPPEPPQSTAAPTDDGSTAKATPPSLKAASGAELSQPAGISSNNQPEEIAAPRLLPAPPTTPEAPTVAQVVASVRNHFPLIQEAAAKRIVASGEALSASGAFDRKLEGFNNWQPLDFFENHWYTWELKRNTQWGGTVAASYKLGRGSFEPWFLERETNDGGEFGIKITAPIGRDQEIDANRANLWRAQLERGRIEPFVQSQVISSVRDAKLAYWQWVASGASQAIARELLDLAIDRNRLLERQVEKGEEAKIKLVDNQRVVLSRSAKLVDAQRKLRKAAIKLSLFYRTSVGRPVLVPDGAAPDSFPAISGVDATTVDRDIEIALAARPELAELEIVRRQLGIELRQARNETRADVDGGLFFGQDVGNPTSSDNKSDFEIEATLAVSVPLERRKALGKVRQVRGKLAALQAKTQFTSDKIGGDVRAARASLEAAALRVEQTTEAVQLARQIVDAETRLYEAGQSTLFNLNLREGQVASAAVEQIAAQFDYFAAQADLDAARGIGQATAP